MKIEHSCIRPRAILGDGVDSVSKIVRCQECGQWWKVVYWPHGTVWSSRIFFPWPNIKHLLWKRRARKQIRFGRKS